MADFYNAFSTTSKEEWIEKVKVDLKGKTIEDVLHLRHPVEELNYHSYGLAEDLKEHHNAPGQADFSRGGSTKSNDWKNNVYIPIDTPKKMNAFALQQLMNGATALTIDISSFDLNECHEIVKNIGFEHITSTIIYKTQAQFDWLNKLTAQDAFFGTTICTEQNNFGFIKNARNKLVRAIDVHHAGGNAKQEIAFALHEGHEVLYNLIKSGISVDDAAPQIKFQFGLGSSYFIEITKFKVFRALWQTIVSHYHPKHSCSAIPYIEAETGFINKSLKDPHNNLLRQTTEASAAIIGGVDELTIRPYDAWSTQPMFDKTQRLGLNIALMLKEESYLDKVIDPAGGAYVLQSLYEELKEKSWDLFQSLEQSFDLKSDIQRVADIRTSLVNKKQQTLIGVNKFLNETPEEQNWKLPANTRFGTPLVLENACKVEI